MKMNWKIKCYGTRGTAPQGGKNFRRYGWNTSCIFLDCGENIIFDSGTGIAAAGKEIGPGPIHVFISHLHYDHIQGLMTFGPLFEQGREIHFYGPGTKDKAFIELLMEVFHSPFWPVALDQVPACVFGHTLDFGDVVRLAADSDRELTIEAVRLQHPDPCLGYVICGAGRKFAYLLDCELMDMDTGSLTSCLSGADYAVMDGSFVPGREKKGWGHSSWAEDVLLARASGVKNLLISHYLEELDDAGIEEQSRLAGTACHFLGEGEEFLF